jgi:hypothetical protein
MNTSGSDNLPVVDQELPLCRSLRSNGMYVFADGENSDPAKDYDDTAYWCLKSLREVGPDGELVGADVCRSAERSCYEPF